MADELDIRTFAEQFRAFLAAVDRITPPPEASALTTRLRDHLGVDPSTLPVVTEVSAPYELANVQAALDAYLARPDVSAELVGISGHGREHQGFTDIIEGSRHHAQYNLGPVDYTTMSVGVAQERSCVSYGLYLITTDLPAGTTPPPAHNHPTPTPAPDPRPGPATPSRFPSPDPDPAAPSTTSSVPDPNVVVASTGGSVITPGDSRIAALVRLSGHRRGPQELLIEALGPDADATRAFLRTIRELSIRHHVGRGQVLSFESHEYGEGVGPLKFHDRPQVDAADVILPSGVLDAVHRQVLGVAEHRERLRAAGHHLKRGVVLFGPPGTGKTHTIRHLIGAHPTATAIVLTGMGVHFIREACNLARLLPPALVVLEDVDLVAEERTMSPMGGGNPLLFQLLNEMDGVDGDADISFLLTTNRLDLVEPALTQRPGRVDLVVEVPLPDEAGRRRLLTLYGVTAHLDPTELDEVVAATAGTTGSFFAELSRRADLLAATANDDRTNLSHIKTALAELRATRAAVAAATSSPDHQAHPYG